MKQQLLFLRGAICISAVALSIMMLYNKTTDAKTELPAGEVAQIPNGIPITDGTPSCIKMYYYIEKYADEYKIPHSYAYGIAYVETSYGGPFDWKYTHSLTSCAGAVGPMQIMHPTAQMMWPDSSFTTLRLRTDIQFNVRTSMKLLRHLYDRYGDWKVVFGCYNTGRPIINEYAHRVYNFKAINK